MDPSGNASAKLIALQLEVLYSGSECLFGGEFLRLLLQFIIEVRSSLEVVEAVEGDGKGGDDVKEEVFLRTVKETTLFEKALKWHEEHWEEASIVQRGEQLFLDSAGRVGIAMSTE
ncbi:hypothetical protein MCOR32_011565 [Pyricularia oryzae]|nr:hypothetical protein MCOR32_011565 [Pyricularia oryzae]